jgi:hypothetical protein
LSVACPIFVSSAMKASQSAGAGEAVAPASFQTSTL